MARPSAVSVSRMMLRFPTAVSPANVTMIVGECCGRIGSILTTVAPELDEDPSARGTGDDVAQVDHREAGERRLRGDARFSARVAAACRAPARRRRGGRIRARDTAARSRPRRIGRSAASSLPRTSAKMPAACAFGSRFPLLPALNRDARHSRAAQLVFPLGRRLARKGGLEQIGQRRRVGESQRQSSPPGCGRRTATRSGRSTIRSPCRRPAPRPRRRAPSGGVRSGAGSAPPSAAPAGHRRP